MPKVLNYTPSWLSRPSSGFDLFSSGNQRTSFGPQDGGHPRARSSDKEQEYLGPRRTIAHRGSEIFLVVDNHIRWADLSIVKYDWESLQRKGKRLEGDDALTSQSYKVSSAVISQTAQPTNTSLQVAQSSDKRADQAAFHLPQWPASCHRYLSHRSCRRPTRLHKIRRKYAEPDQATDTYRRPHYPCTLPIADRQHPVASIGC